MNRHNSHSRKWVLIDYKLADSGKVLEKEERLALKAGEMKIPPFLELWIPSRKCFVLGKVYAIRLTESQRKNLTEARIPIYIRASGGGLILHDPTCLNFGLAVPREIIPEQWGIDRIFFTLSSGVVLALQKLKICVYHGKVKVFCPGSFDLLVKKKKIAGLSLLVREKFCLLHGTLFVQADSQYLETLERFYGPAIRDEIISLQRLKNDSVNMEDITLQIVKGYQESLNVIFKPLRNPDFLLNFSE